MYLENLRNSTGRGERLKGKESLGESTQKSVAFSKRSKKIRRGELELLRPFRSTIRSS